MGEGLLQGFEPLFPAVTFSCQLCGTKISEDLMLTRNTRSLSYGMGEYVFCTICSPHIGKMEMALAEFENRKRAEFENTLREEKRTLAQTLLDEITSRVQHEAAGPSAPPSDERPSPRSSRPRAPRPGQIPNPKAS